MVNFDKFEQNVKKKYGNQEFPFDEQNWEKAAKMIDASRQGKNRGGIFLLSAVALLCTTGLVYYFGFSGSTKPLEKNNLAVNETTAKNENPLVTDMKPENSGTENNFQPATENTSENSATESKNEVNPDINSVSDNSSKRKSNTKTSSGTFSINKSESVNNSSSSENSSVQSEEKTNTNSENTANDTKANSIKNTEAKKPAQTKSNTQKTTPAVLGNNSNNSNNEIKGTTPVASTNVGGNGDKLGDTENNSTPQTTPTKNNPEIIDPSNPVVAVNEKATPSKVVDSIPPVRKGKTDSLAAMIGGDGISYATNVKEKHNAKNILFAEAGGTYLLGWGGGKNNDANGFNLLDGLNFQHYFTGTIAAQIGIQYSTVANLSNTTHTISTVKYDLGIEQDVTRIKYQTLHYIVAPIKFTYNLKDKNSFGIGCNVAYLLNSNSKKEKYKTYSSDPNATKNNLTSTKESGYVQGFSPYDIQLSASYRRKIYKGLSASVEFFYGLTDTKDNSFFKTNNFDRNTGFKVSLCYDLFKK